MEIQDDNPAGVRDEGTGDNSTSSFIGNECWGSLLREQVSHWASEGGEAEGEIKKETHIMQSTEKPHTDVREET